MTKLIVELCQNHNGDRELFARMIKAAADSGADYVKMQSIFSSDVTKRDRFEEGVTFADGTVQAIKRPYGAEKARLSKLDLSLDDHLFFIEKCKEFGVVPLTTIFSRHTIPLVASLPWPQRVVKVASYDCASLPMLRELADHFDWLIVSTGATYDEEIRQAAKLFTSLGKKFSFLHCVTSYPNSLEIANLSRMDWLREFTDEVGWSDHTHVERDGIKAAKVAIMLGANFIERHFTVLEKGETKDGPVSVTPALLKELSDFRNLSKEQQRVVVEKEIPEWQGLVGTPQRKMTPTELLNRDYYRGRFASPGLDGEWVYNWEDKPVLQTKNIAAEENVMA
jgi:sialic acid synthase SpsE